MLLFLPNSRSSLPAFMFRRAPNLFQPTTKDWVRAIVSPRQLFSNEAPTVDVPQRLTDWSGLLCRADSADETQSTSSRSHRINLASPHLRRSFAGIRGAGATRIMCQLLCSVHYFSWKRPPPYVTLAGFVVSPTREAPLMSAAFFGCPLFTVEMRPASQTE